MKYFFLVIQLVSVIQVALSQKLIPLRIDDRWGYSNINAEIIIPVVYDEASKFNQEGQAEVSIGNLSFCINKMGKKAQCVKEDGRCGGVGATMTKQLIKYEVNGKFGILTKSMREPVNNLSELYKLDTLPPIWDELHGNGYGLVAAKSNNKWDILNVNGEVIVENKYDNIQIERSFFITEKNNRFGFVDNSAEIIIEPKYSRVEFSLTDEYVTIRTAKAKKGFVSHKGIEYFKDN